jgi:carboxypeptidase family protein/TonB-dependent receptor-like protein
MSRVHVVAARPVLLFVQVFVAFLLLSGSASAQFTGNIQGTVEDPSGAAIPQAKVSLLNVATQASATATTDATGGFRFLSLAPGSYKITVEAAGFGKAEATVSLVTNQNLNVPISVKVGTGAETVTVTSETPLVNTTETRNQMTLQTKELSTLPLAGRSMFSLVTVAPGVSGLGTTAGGSPGSGVDNFSTETEVDASANGQGRLANMWVVDGLDVTSAIRQGVLNLTPNPDVVQEAVNQINTFTVEYGHSSSIQFVMTTKSGQDRFHGLVSDYFNYQDMYAKYSLPGSDHPYNPFHSHNISATIGGPIIPNKQFFFFAAVEPLRSSASTGNQVLTFPDPQFAAWARANHPNTFGTKILNTYAPSNATVSGVTKTAQDIFPGTCGTAATDNLPCSTAMIDSGVFNSSNFRNGMQYFVRIDKSFSKDRIYASFFRTTLDFGGPAVIPQFSTTNHNTQAAIQVNWTHTFSPTTLNEAIYGQNRIEGFLGETGDFSIPGISVTGQSVGYGVGFAQGNFIQHNYLWRDVLTHVRGAHVLKVGYEGWFGDDVEPFQGPWSHPGFSFDNLLKLAQDAPQTEGGVMYNPITGQQQLWDWNAASKTWGAFVQDTWKARRNLTLTLGLRFDNQGNPYSRSDSTVFGNFLLGTGSTFEQQVANGVATPSEHALKGAPKVWNPRLGAAWDVNGKGDWLVRGGLGMYANWLTPANIQEQFRGNPPGLILPTFFANSSSPPIFTQGTTDTPPFGFRFPALAGTSLCPRAPCLDAKGGIQGAAAGIGGINPDIKAPRTYIWSLTLEHRLGNRMVASLLYSGAHSSHLVSGGNQLGQVSYGTDINALPGDLLGKPPGSAPTRLNSSFGPITYTDNGRVGNYNGITFDLRGRFHRAYFDTSYTRSSSKDDAGVYPTSINPHQFYGPSPWDVPNRFSFSGSYDIRGSGRLKGGWGVSGTSIYQSGYPFTVFNGASFTGGGDYNADGDNLDYPNVDHYGQGTGDAFLTGIFTPGQFTAPTLGTNGNEKANQFRNPHFIQTDLTVYKNTQLWKTVNFQLRFEFYNLFNHPNFTNVVNDLSAGNFGTVSSQTLPRWWQIGAKLEF